MTDSQLIRDVKKLKTIRPRQDWVLETKRQILGELEDKKSPNLFLFFRLATASLLVLTVVFGLFGFSLNAVPGDNLYYFKKLIEKGQIMLSSESQKPVVNLELANKRLDELNKIVADNDVKKLAPAIDEFQSNMSDVAKELTKVNKIDKEIVVQTTKLNENKEKVESVLSTKLDTQDYDYAVSQVVARQITDLEAQTLSDSDAQILSQIKTDYANGNYSDALVKILDLSQPDTQQ